MLRLVATTVLIFRRLTGRLPSVVLGLLGGAGVLMSQVKSPDPLLQLMLTQPPMDVSTNVTVTAELDPPIIAAGEQSTYRVTISALDDSIRWPADILAPLDLTLQFGSRAQMLEPGADRIRPFTTINHHVTARRVGTYTIPEFKVQVYGNPVTVPAVQLKVVATPPDNLPPAPRLYLQLTETNIYCGQPVEFQVYLPSPSNNFVQALSQMQLNGDGVLLDQSAARQRVQALEFMGRLRPVFIYESTLTPLVAGRLDVSAQGFTMLNPRGTPTGVSPRFLLLDSDTVQLNVEPLPRTGELPGFTGAIGKFSALPPQLSAGVIRVGDMVKLMVAFESQSGARRLVAPPPPAVTNWQVYPAVSERSMMPPAGNPNGPGAIMAFSYTLIPLADHLTETPAIPFSSFDPEQKQYVDLTIPPQPIRVEAGAASAEAQALAQAAAAPEPESKLQLSELADAPGRRTNPFAAPQLSRGFLIGQLVPFAALVILWYWARRRQFLERHPEVVRKRAARRALRQERRVLRAAARANDEARFASSAVQALRLACAPHFPAAPAALVSRDILEVFDEPTRTSRAAEMVRAFFVQTDEAQFGATPPPAGELLGWQSELNVLLDVLEAKL
ncbi:MAG: BatD family protein [Verrucomicrobiae bacterium]|nr:BatD family protein [Verrucomicrobiae bacterium]